MNKKQAGRIIELMGKMGKVVTVSSVLRKRRSSKRNGDGSYNQTWDPIPLTIPRGGWIIGERSLREGRYFYGGPDSPGSLRIEGKVKVLLVCFWPTTRGVYVLACIDGGMPVSPGTYASLCAKSLEGAK